MKNAPNSRANLDKAILWFAGNPLRANEIRNLMANAIVAQMIGEAVAWVNGLIGRIDRVY